MLAIGGWNAESAAFSDLVSNPGNRRVFILSVIPYLRKNGFNGLDIDWEYPTLRGGKPEDKYRFSQLVSVSFIHGYILKCLSYSVFYKTINIMIYVEYF